MAGVLSREQQALEGTGAAPDASLTVIEPTHGWRALDLRELWSYRELVYFLAWRDVKVRYKQTALGVAWVVLQPLAAMAIFSVVFGRLANLPSDGVPYPLFVFAGLVPWFYFANATSTASGSLVANTNLVSKVYFPRLAVPLAAVLAGLVDLAIGLVLELVLLAVFGVPPTPRLLLVPVLVLLLALTALAVSIWLSALDVQYRDVRYAIPFLIQLWLFATPVVYPLSVVSDRWQWLFALNPVTGTIETFRWALLGSGEFPAPQLALGVVTTLLLLGSGLLYFRRVERTFADVI
ncbi:MAG: ABC transporter permease [Chloroflexi bacterium]|nr:ABC transporter permease [Chloroflexota bacterium]